MHYVALPAPLAEVVRSSLVRAGARGKLPLYTYGGALGWNADDVGLDLDAAWELLGETAAEWLILRGTAFRMVGAVGQRYYECAATGYSRMSLSVSDGAETIHVLADALWRTVHPAEGLFNEPVQMLEAPWVGAPAYRIAAYVDGTPVLCLYAPGHQPGAAAEDATRMLALAVGHALEHAPADTPSRVVGGH